jgi:tetratricopeptide (TPR) repeat protein
VVHGHTDEGAKRVGWQQDYLLRMIEDLNLFMSRIIKLRREARPEEALDLLVGETSRISGIPPTLVYALSDDDLIQTLTARGALEPERCFAIGELFREEGLVCAELGQEDEASARFSKATRLYTEALRHATPEQDNITIDGLRETLDHLHATWIDPRTLDLLLETLIERGAVDLADNVVFELREQDDANDHVERAAGVYRAILEHSDYTLSRAGIERSEIEESLAALPVMN